MSDDKKDNKAPRGAERLRQARPISDAAIASVATNLPIGPVAAPAAAPAPNSGPEPAPVLPGAHPVEPAPRTRRRPSRANSPAAGTNLPDPLNGFTLPAAPREKTVPVNLSWLPSFRNRLDTFCEHLGNGWNRSNLTQYVMTEIMNRLEAQSED